MEPLEHGLIGHINIYKYIFIFIIAIEQQEKTKYKLLIK